MELTTTSLEELGWRFSYDIGGKYPLSKDDSVIIRPGETTELYFRHRPIQKEDGRFYGNAVMANKQFPMFFFGMYRRRALHNSISLFGKENGYSALIGRVESFSMWERGVDDALVANYTQNQTKMIGDGAGYLYKNTEEAKNDGLFLHYDIGTQGLLVKNYNQGTALIKSSDFPITQGKDSNASRLDNYSDYMLLDNTEFRSQFSINFRFYMEIERDFTLFYGENIGHIHYDANNREMIIELYPYIGNIKKYYIQVPDLNIHYWYDFTVSYANGVLTTYLNGEKLETHYPNIDIGGVYSLILDYSNIESVEVDSTLTHRVYSREDADGEVRFINFSGEVLNFNSEITFDKGGKNLLNLLYDEKNNKKVDILINSNNVVSEEIEVIDEINELFFLKGRYKTFDTDITQISIENSIDDSITIKSLYGEHKYLTKYGNTLWTDALLPNGYIKIKIKYKDELQSTEPVFPMVFTLPNLPITTKEIDVTNHRVGYITGNNTIRDIGSVGLEWYTFYAGVEVECLYIENSKTLSKVKVIFDNDKELQFEKGYIGDLFADSGRYARGLSMDISIKNISKLTSQYSLEKLKNKIVSILPIKWSTK